MNDGMSDRLLSVASEVIEVLRDWDDERAIAVVARNAWVDEPLEGEKPGDVAKVLLLLSDIDRRLGDTTRAERRLRDALHLMLPDTPVQREAVYLSALVGLADLLAATGRYRESAACYADAIKVARQQFLDQDTDLPQRVLIQAGLFHLNIGNYEMAESLCTEAVDLMGKSLAGNPLVSRAVLSTLSAVYMALGNAAMAEPLERDSLAISRAGEDPKSLVDDLCSLASTCFLAGRKSEATELLDMAAQAIDDIVDDSGSVIRNAEMLQTLAKAYWFTDEGTRAEQSLERALSMVGPGRVGPAGQGGPARSTSWTTRRGLEARIAGDLAALYARRGAAELAEPLVARMVQIRRVDATTALRAMPDDAAKLSTALEQAAALRRQMGDYPAAEAFAREATELWAQRDEDPVTDGANALRELARACLVNDKSAEALHCLRRAAAIDDRLADHVFAMGSDAQRSSFVRLLRPTTVLTLTMAAEDPKFLFDAFALVLRRKGLDAEAIAVRRDVVLGDRYPHLRGKLDEIRSRRIELAGRMVVNGHNLESHAQKVAELAGQVARLEKEIARDVPEISVAGNLRGVDASAVLNALPAGSTLVELVQFGREDLRRPLGTRGHGAVISYGAFVLPAGDLSRLAFIVLGVKGEIDAAIDAYRDAVADRYTPGPNTGGSRSALNDAERELRMMVFDPLLPALGGNHQILISPDGELSRVPFQALSVDDDRRLIDNYSISYIGAGRDLIRFKLPPVASTSPVVVADPDFDLTASTALDQPSAASGNQSCDLGRGVGSFDPLPGARREGVDVAGRLGVEALIGKRALKAGLQSLRSPLILHLATHGFFLPVDPSVLDNLDPGEELPELAHGWQKRRRLENPLLRCGLALAGANTWLRDGTVQVEAGDGILNGEEATGMDLHGTELVVLSACDTGLGDVHVGEGVIGLPRAFALAGAKAVMMSLWKVPDAQTQRLMSEMYARLLTGVPRAEALRDAQLVLKESSPHPKDWGGFICMGNPGPLPERA